jgi:hypothetical protein
LFGANWAISQPYNDEKKLHFDDIMMMMSALHYSNTLALIL